MCDNLVEEKVGLPSAPPYLSLASSSQQLIQFNNVQVTGVSFASGGAGILNTTEELFVRILMNPRSMNVIFVLVYVKII